jgi:hypothetical protein
VLGAIFCGDIDLREHKHGHRVRKELSVVLGKGENTNDDERSGIRADPPCGVGNAVVAYSGVRRLANDIQDIIDVDFNVNIVVVKITRVFISHLSSEIEINVGRRRALFLPRTA